MPQRDEFFFPLQVIKELWGREWELIAQWAVGEDWSTTPFDHWPERMTARTGVKVPPEEDMPLSLDRIKHAWDHRADPAYKRPMIAAEPVVEQQTLEQAATQQDPPKVTVAPEAPPVLEQQALFDEEFEETV